MTPDTQQLLQAVVAGDSTAVQEIIASGADINAADELDRNVLHYAALGPAINSLESQHQIRLSERRLEVLRLVSQHDQLSLYSLNAPLPWAGGVTLLGLMSWLNMPVEIMCLLKYAQGLLEVNAMDEQGANALMYAARDGNMQVVQQLLARGARSDLKDVSQRSAIQYSVSHPEILWLCEETLRRTRRIEFGISMTMQPRKRKLRPNTPFPDLPADKVSNTLFYSNKDKLLSPPILNLPAVRRRLDSLLQAMRNQDTSGVRKILSGSHESRPQTAPILVNFCDEAGLAPIHHACSQRPSPNVEIADALYFAGADMGLYSTLGFTPLHHLARTARDSISESKDLDSPLDPIQSVEDSPLYIFTLHLIRRLHAPLRATDSRGETPLHAAAEHGRSIAVLKAMLECDKEYSGQESVRELRNERGLRPVDVAQLEFVPIIMGELPDSLKKPPRPPPLKLLPMTKDVSTSAHNTPRSPRHNVSFALVKKASDMSIKSKSSGSSSSGDRSQTSFISQRSSARQWHKPSSFHGIQANPYPSPPPSYSGSPASTAEQLNGAFDISTSTMDILYNLSLSASALHSYSQPQQDENSVPDLMTISETLSASRDLATHVLDHWLSQLEIARAEYDRINKEILKAEELLRRVAKATELAAVRPDKRKQLSKSFREDKPSVSRKADDNALHDPPVSEVGVRTSLESNNSHSSLDHNQSTTVSSKSGRLRFDLSARANDNNGSRSSVHHSTASEDELGRVPKHNLDKLSSTLSTAPKILQRADADIHSIEANMLSMGKLFEHVEEAISETHVLVDEAIKLREDQLSIVLRAYHGLDYFLHSSRLSPILEKSSDGGHTSPSSTSTITDLYRSTTISDFNTLELLEEPHLLRHLLMHKINKDVWRIIEGVQKAHVWLRVIREVLRGLRRRIYFER